MSVMGMLYGCYEGVVMGSTGAIMGSTGAIKALDERYEGITRAL